MSKLVTTGHPLETARHAAQLTTAQVAAHIGVGEVTVRRWELGHTMPSHSKILTLARLYGVADPLTLYAEPTND